MLLMYPDLMLGNCVNAAGLWSATIADNDDKLAFLVTVPKTGTLARVGFLTGTTGFTTAANIAVRIETVANKLPTGTLYHASGTGTQTSPVAGTWYRPQINGATGIPVTMGDRIAVVLSCPSGSPNLTVVRNLGTNGNDFANVTYATYGTSWSEGGGCLAPFVLEYGDGSCPNIGSVPVRGLAISGPINQNTTGTTYGDELGLQLTLPFGGRAIGIRASANLAGFPKFCMYSGTTLIASTPDIPQNSHFLSPQVTTHWFSTPVTITAGQTYILSLRPWNSGTNTSLYEFGLNQAAYMEAVGLDPADGAVSRVDLGPWEAVDHLRVPVLGLVFDEITQGGSHRVPPIYGV